MTPLNDHNDDFGSSLTERERFVLKREYGDGLHAFKKCIHVETEMSTMHGLHKTLTPHNSRPLRMLNETKGEATK